MLCVFTSVHPTPCTGDDISKHSVITESITSSWRQGGFGDVCPLFRRTHFFSFIFSVFLYTGFFPKLINAFKYLLSLRKGREEEGKRLRGKPEKKTQRKKKNQKGKLLQFYLVFFFWQCQAACGILVSSPGIEPAPPEVEARSLNHWTAREAPILFSYLGYFTIKLLER